MANFLLILLDTLAGIGNCVAIIFTKLLFTSFHLAMFCKKKIAFKPKKIQKKFAPQRNTYRKRQIKQQKRTNFIGLKTKYFFVGTTFSFLFIFFPLLIIIGILTLPDITTLRLQQFPQTTKIYDRHHILLYQMYANQNRTLVHLNQVPLFLQQGTIAIEDKNFYKNPGFDLLAIGRALVIDSTGTMLQGGSTITQQLIKSSLLSSERTLTRKVQELILAFLAEHIYTKDQILEMYFNQVPYGGTAWGVEAAAQTYFGEEVNKLDLAQSAFLAGLPQAPTTYSPFEKGNTLWKKRQKEVLFRMRVLGYITKEQERNATAEMLHFILPRTPLLAPHFVMYIRNLLIQKYGLPLVEKGGLTVTTSLDLTIQNMTQQVVANEVNADEYLNLTNGAAVVTNPQSGDILAMIGSKDYYASDIDGNVNLATSLRQPGSSIKIVTYAAALSNGYTPATMIDDSPIVYKNDWETYAPVDYDGHWHGWVTLRTALANSLNIPAVKTLSVVGIPTFVHLGQAMGLTHLQEPNHYGLSVTLGSAEVTMLDMATAYGVLANQGNRIDLNPILSVIDSKGNILEKKESPHPVAVFSPGIAYLLTNILSDNIARSMEFGLHSPLVISGNTVAVKTGTTDDKRDNWTDGYTPNYVVIVWVGNNDNTPMSQTLASGITGAAPIWHAIMSHLLQQNKAQPFYPPSDITSKVCFGRIEYFLKETESTTNCSTIYPTWTPVPIPVSH